MRRSARFVIAALGTASLLALGACSSSTTTETPAGTTAGSAPGTTAGTTPGTTKGTTPGSAPTNDQEAATSALLTDDQLPPGSWKASLPLNTEPRSDMTQTISTQPECTSITSDLGIVASQRTAVANAEWSSTTASSTGELSNTVELYSTVQPVQVSQVLVESPSVTDCLVAAMNTQILANPDETVTVTGQVEATRYDVGLHSQELGVDWVQGWRFSFQLTNPENNESIDAFSRVVMFGYGRGIGTVSTAELMLPDVTAEVPAEDLAVTVQAAADNLKTVAG